MTFGGKGENPIVMPMDHSGGLPLRVPDQPPSDSRMFWERALKWVGIAFVVLTLALFVYLVIFGLEPDLTDAQITQTQVARNSDN